MRSRPWLHVLFVYGAWSIIQGIRRIFLPPVCGQSDLRTKPRAPKVGVISGLQAAPAPRRQCVAHRTFSGTAARNASANLCALRHQRDLNPAFQRGSGARPRIIRPWSIIFHNQGGRKKKRLESLGKHHTEPVLRTLHNATPKWLCNHSTILMVVVGRAQIGQCGFSLFGPFLGFLRRKARAGRPPHAADRWHPGCFQGVRRSVPRR